MKLFRALLATSALTLLSTIPSLGQSSAPAPIAPVPTAAQLAWHELETYAFIHFGLNTYNDLEWGYGNTPASTFNPPILDVEQWVTTLKRAGMKGVILTAKHHDGFCLWPTETTEYSIRNSPYKQGKGDLVKELSEACRRHGLQFGLYLSPWDRNNKDYGFPAYQRTFHRQIHELTTHYGKLFEYWFDGANGGTGWYGGADSARSIDPNSYYRYEEAAKMLRRNNKDIMIFGGTVPTIRWIGNEAGWAGQTNWGSYDPKAEKHYTEAQWGHRDAKQWLPGEVDVSIRPGWFYHHREDHQVRSVANLVNLYYQSVGRGANLLLNCPINLDGKIPATDSARLIAWHSHLQRSFQHNLLRGIAPSVTNQRPGKLFLPQHLTDGNIKTYWAGADGTKTAQLTFRLPRPTELNTVALQEYLNLGQRVERFRLEVADATGRFSPVQTTDSMTTIGYKRLIRFSAVKTSALRLTIDEARGPVCLAEVAAYLAPEVLEAPSVRRNAQDSVYIRTTAANAKLEYAVLQAGQDPQKAQWSLYTKPFYLPGDHLTILARVSTSVNPDKPLTTFHTGYSLSEVQVPGLEEAERQQLFDGNGYSQVVLHGGVRSLALEFPTPRRISRLIYSPTQQRDAEGHIQRYELYLDGELVASGEFANIRNNPIPVAIDLPQAKEGKTLRLVVTKTVGDTKNVVLGDLAVE